jgi:hypothetical protein
VAIAGVAAAAALWLAFHARKASHRMAASLAMAGAVCAMHYTGMSAAEFICIANAPKPLWSIGAITPLVFTVVGLVLVWLIWNTLGIILQDQVRRTPAGASAGLKGGRAPTRIRVRLESRASSRRAPRALTQLLRRDYGQQKDFRLALG